MKALLNIFAGSSLLLPALAQAADTAAKSEPARQLAGSPLSAASLLQTLMGLVLVLMVIGLLAFLLRRSSQFYGLANSELKIVASMSLGPREKAVVIQLGEQQLLLGVTPQQINTLHVLAQPLATARSAGNQTAFADRLKQMLQQQKDRS